MATLAARRAITRPGAVAATALSLQPRDSFWFGRTYENHVGSVFRYALLMVRDPVRAEDVTAEVFLRAWRSRESFRGDGTPLSWLLSITHNCALTLLRSERSEADVDAIEEPRDPTGDPAGHVDAESDKAELQRAIGHLTAEQQQVVLLRFFEGLPHDQVAARLGRNPNAVRAIQFRALCRLRRLLEDRRVEIA